MKTNKSFLWKSIFILISSIFSLTSIYAQTYLSILDESGIWNQSSSWSDLSTAKSYSWKYEFSGDTIIGSHTYKKLYKTYEEITNSSYDNQLQQWTSSTYVSGDDIGYKGGLGEDSGRVFFLGQNCHLNDTIKLCHEINF